LRLRYRESSEEGIPCHDSRTEEAQRTQSRPYTRWCRDVISKDSKKIGFPKHNGEENLMWPHKRMDEIKM